MMSKKTKATQSPEIKAIEENGVKGFEVLGKKFFGSDAKQRALKYWYDNKPKEKKKVKKSSKKTTKKS